MIYGKTAISPYHHITKCISNWISILLFLHPLLEILTTGKSYRIDIRPPFPSWESSNTSTIFPQKNTKELLLEVFPGCDCSTMFHLYFLSNLSPFHRWLQQKLESHSILLETQADLPPPPMFDALNVSKASLFIGQIWDGHPPRPALTAPWSAGPARGTEAAWVLQPRRSMVKNCWWNIERFWHI